MDTQINVDKEGKVERSDDEETIKKIKFFKQI